MRADGDEEYIREVASYLDEKMRGIAESLPDKSPARVAILAALNITDEMYRERAKSQNESSSVTKRAHDIISMLDEKLSEKND